MPRSIGGRLPPVVPLTQERDGNNFLVLDPCRPPEGRRFIATGGFAAPGPRIGHPFPPRPIRGGGRSWWASIFIQGQDALANDRDPVRGQAEKLSPTTGPQIGNVFLARSSGRLTIRRPDARTVSSCPYPSGTAGPGWLAWYHLFPSSGELIVLLPGILRNPFNQFAHPGPGVA